MSELVLTDQNFEEEVLKSAKPVLVDFFASWCGPCKMQLSIIEEIAKEIGDQAKIGKLDVDQNEATAQKYEVMSVPTLIFFKNGKLVEALTGMQSKGALKNKLDALI